VAATVAAAVVEVATAGGEPRADTGAVAILPRP
jgi:hypothetical protein